MKAYDQKIIISARQYCRPAVPNPSILLVLSALRPEARWCGEQHRDQVANYLASGMRRRLLLWRKRATVRLSRQWAGRRYVVLAVLAAWR